MGRSPAPVLVAALLLAALGTGARPAPPNEPEVGTRLARGRVLVASRALTAPAFARSVILLLDYGRDGALGLVINRPTRFALHELLPEVERLAGTAHRAWYGGPVAAGQIHLLIRSQTMLPGATPLVDDVWVTASAPVLDAVLADPALEFRAFVGYTGWAPGQLDAEVIEGSWMIAPGRGAEIFAEDPSTLWDRLTGETERVPARAPGSAGEVLGDAPHRHGDGLSRGAFGGEPGAPHTEELAQHRLRVGLGQALLPQRIGEVPSLQAPVRHQLHGHGEGPVGLVEGDDADLEVVVGHVILDGP